jgi:hypothetical protein
MAIAILPVIPMPLGTTNTEIQQLPYIWEFLMLTFDVYLLTTTTTTKPVSPKQVGVGIYVSNMLVNSFMHICIKHVCSQIFYTLIYCIIGSTNHEKEINMKLQIVHH